MENLVSLESNNLALTKSSDLTAVKRKFSILWENRSLRMQLKVLILVFLHMDKLEVVRLTLCMVRTASIS